MSDAEIISMKEGRRRLRKPENWCATEWRVKDREPLIETQARRMQKRIDREKRS